MGKKERADMREALTELHRVSKRDRYESDDYYAANARVAETEKHVGLLENLWVRNTMDD